MEQNLKVFVTGASGFLGSHLIPALKKRGFEIICLVKESSVPSHLSDCTIIHGGLNEDLTSQLKHDKIRQVDVVVHAAAVINASEKEFQEINIDGTKNIISLARVLDAKHFVFISSNDVDYNTLYGDSKIGAEKLVKNSWIPYTIFRPGPIYGVGDTKNFMEIFRMAKKRFFIPVIGDGSYLRQPIHVDDVVDSIIAVLKQKKAFGKTYYLGGPKISYDNILKIIIKTTHRNPRVIHIPVWIGTRLALFMHSVGLGPVTTKDQLVTITRNKFGDTDPFKENFGISPRSFEIGFPAVIDEIKNKVSDSAGYKKEQ